MSKADQAEMLNETMKYFREQDNFSLDDFSEKVIRQPEVMESFSRYKQEYEQERDIRIEDEFAISDSAVRKQARAYKSVIKLDRNFHIYVHGNRNLLEQGEDERASSTRSITRRRNNLLFRAELPCRQGGLQGAARFFLCIVPNNRILNPLHREQIVAYCVYLYMKWGFRKVRQVAALSRTACFYGSL